MLNSAKLQNFTAALAADCRKGPSAAVRRSSVPMPQMPHNTIGVRQVRQRCGPESAEISNLQKRAIAEKHKWGEQQGGVYAIRCPETMDVVCVGRSNWITRRFASHMAGGPGLGRGKREWFVALRTRGLAPVLEVLSSANTADAERWWTAYFRARGASLRFMVHGRVPETKGTQQRRALLAEIAELKAENARLRAALELL